MSHHIPSYRQHKPSKQAIVTLSGRDFYLGAYGTEESRREYDRLVAEWIANGRRLPSDAGTSITIAELLNDYLDYAREYYKTDSETTSEYTGMVEAVRPLNLLYASTEARQFGPLSLKAVRQKMVDKGWCRKHINRSVSRLRRVFKWGVENEMVPATVLEGLKAVAPLRKDKTEARESEPVKPVPSEHVDLVLRYVSRQVAAMIELQRLTGMRPGEVVLLRPADVERADPVWIYTPTKHKTEYRGHSRVIYLGPKAQAVLRPWLDRAPKAHCFSPKEAEAERNAVRRTNRQSPMTPSQSKRKPKANPKRPKQDKYTVSSYRRAITYAIRKSGCPHWHPHQLRHFTATKVRGLGGLDIAQIILGHTNAKTTEIYAEVERDRVIEFVRKNG